MSINISKTDNKKKRAIDDISGPKVHETPADYSGAGLAVPRGPKRRSCANSIRCRRSTADEADEADSASVAREEARAALQNQVEEDSASGESLSSSDSGEYSTSDESANSSDLDAIDDDVSSDSSASYAPKSESSD